MLRASRSIVPVGAIVGLAALLASAGSRTIAGLMVRIVDGDTIHVRIDGRTEKVRYSTLVLGKHVRLELDVRERDRYGRLLAYVWIDDVMVNAELVRRGYAQVMTVPPNVRYQDLFRRHERETRESGRGLWRRPLTRPMSSAPTAATNRSPAMALAPEGLTARPCQRAESAINPLRRLRYILGRPTTKEYRTMRYVREAERAR